MRYIIVNSTDDIINAVEWDGVSLWSPPTSCVAIQTVLGDIGWKWNNGSPFDPTPPTNGTSVFVDLSNFDNLDKVIKALGLVVAQYANKTAAQVKSDFLTKYNSL